MQKRQTARPSAPPAHEGSARTVQSLRTAHKLSFMASAHEEKGVLRSHFRGRIKMTEDEAGWQQVELHIQL